MLGRMWKANIHKLQVQAPAMSCFHHISWSAVRLALKDNL